MIQIPIDYVLGCWWLIHVPVTTNQQDTNSTPAVIPDLPWWYALISLRIFAEESLQVFLWHPKVWEHRNNCRNPWNSRNKKRFECDSWCFIMFIDHLSQSLYCILLHVIYVLAFFCAGWQNVCHGLWVIMWKVADTPKSISFCEYIVMLVPHWLCNLKVSRTLWSFNVAILSQTWFTWSIYRWSTQKTQFAVIFHSYIMLH